MEVVYYLLGIMVLIFLGKILLIPMKTIWKLVTNGIIGGITLVLFNLLGGILGLSIEISPLKAILVGIFGLPAVILFLII